MTTTNSEINTEITKEKLDKYFAITKEGLTMAKGKFNQESEEMQKQAADFYNMAECYFNDAKHFRDQKQDWVLAFAALNYAHGWLDAGARAKLFLVENSRVFTVDGPYE